MIVALPVASCRKSEDGCFKISGDEEIPWGSEHIMISVKGNTALLFYTFRLVREIIYKEAFSIKQYDNRYSSGA